MQNPKVVQKPLPRTLATQRYVCRTPFRHFSSLTVFQLEARKEALRRDPEYGKYIEKLVGAGFFQDELEGSAKWLKLEDQAARVWVEARKKECVAPPLISTSRVAV